MPPWWKTLHVLIQAIILFKYACLVLLARSLFSVVLKQFSICFYLNIIIGIHDFSRESDQLIHRITSIIAFQWNIYNISNYVMVCINIHNILG
jgi:hypothetical protein